jgi:putative membrane protein
LHPFTPFLRGWKVFVGIAVVATTQLHDQLGNHWLWTAVLAALPVGAAYGFVSWHFTSYAIHDGDLRVDTGVLFRRSRRVRLDRLQAVDVVRPLVARALGLAELRLEVAGGSSAEAPLAYLAEGDALALRAEMLARAAGLHEETPEAPEHVLEVVPFGRLVRGELLRGQIWVGAVLVLVAGSGAAFTGSPAALFALLPALIAFVGVPVRRVVNDFDFTLATSPDGLRLRHGLLETRSQTVPPGRVQALRVVEPWLWRRVGWARVEVTVAGYMGEHSESSQVSVLMPVIPVGDLSRLLAVVLPGVSIPEVRLFGVPRRARWLDPVGVRFRAAGADERVFVSRRGRFRRETDVVPHERTQSLRLAQGWLQRVLGLVSLHLDTTPGPVHVVAAHRAADEARALLDREVVLARAARAADRTDRWMRDHGSADAPSGEDRAT